MDINFYNKVTLYSAIFTIVICHNVLLCMNQTDVTTNHHLKLRIPPHPYPPTLKNSFYESDSSIEHIISNLTIVREENNSDRFGTCRAIVATEYLGITGQASTHLKIHHDSDIIKVCNFIQYFDPTDRPILDSLVVYTDETNYIHHMAIATEVSSNNPQLCTVKGKCGSFPGIVAHKLFNSPDSYGNRVFFYNLKPKFQDKKHLLRLMQQDIKSSKQIELQLIEDQKLLIKLANGKNISQPKFHLFDEQKTIERKTIHLLKTCIGLNINTRTSINKQTVTMLAAKRDDAKLVSLFLEMGANGNMQDINGNTALHLASQKNAHNVVSAILLNKNTDITIKNNDRSTATVMPMPII